MNRLESGLEFGDVCFDIPPMFLQKFVVHRGCPQTACHPPLWIRCRFDHRLDRTVLREEAGWVLLLLLMLVFDFYLPKQALLLMVTGVEVAEFFR